MPAKKFRFVSPGVQVKEIDKSILPSLAGAIGPVVIGRSLKGPTMVPVTVNSYEEFVQVFGEPDPGLGSEDVWRNGNNTAPTYGAYAAQSWLASSSPLTFLRLAGTQNYDATTDGYAGWQTKNDGDSLQADNGGAMGLFLVPSSSANTDQTGSLAAIFYINEGSIELVGKSPDDTDVAQGAGSCVMVKSLNDRVFKAIIRDKGGDVVEKVSFNFVKESSKFIRKTFNTNPTLVNSVVYDEESVKTYWLGESFEDFIFDEGILEASAEGSQYAFLAPLKVGNVPGKDFSNFRKQASPSKTGWVFGQDTSAETGSYNIENQAKLFRFVCGPVGENAGSDWEQNNYKISVFDIKPPKNDFQKYGTFSVGIRNMADSDKSPEFVEVFSNVNLDPNSPDYIAARIGDRRVEWVRDSASGEERYVELGDFDNNSKIVRVEMHPSAKSQDASILPAGFFGPTRPKTFSIEGDQGVPTEASSSINAANADPNKYDNAAAVKTFIANYSASIVFPSLPLLESSADAEVLDDTQAYFGFKASAPLKQSIKDLLKVKPSGISTHIKDDQTEYSFVFSLDDVKYDEDSGVATWAAGSRVAGLSYTATGSTPGVSDNTFEDLLDLGFNKFTMPLFGGFDGFDIKEREPFRNSQWSTTTVAKSSYSFNSVERAIKSLKDPEVLDMNLLLVPGITNKTLTNNMIKICENRADCLAIIDLEGGYVPDTENNLSDNSSSRLGSVSSTVAAVKDRQFNSSYGCAYYPWVQMVDPNVGVKLWIPPSIVAFGTMASSQENSEIWFAPAGFNRGGLSVGSSGLNITAVRDKLTAKNRDALYERNVNPIASFPSEGLVIFGQKTLQAFPSALDRINVRRLVIFLKKEISRIAANVLFEPNVQTTWNRFATPTRDLLEEVKTGLGISDYRVVLDETTTTPEEIDRNMMYAKLFIKPVYAIEFIGIDFVITNTGASFDDL